MTANGQNFAIPPRNLKIFVAATALTVGAVGLSASAQARHYGWHYGAHYARDLTHRKALPRTELKYRGHTIVFTRNT